MLNHDQRTKKTGHHPERAGNDLRHSARLTRQHALGEEGAEVLQGWTAQSVLPDPGCRGMAVKESNSDDGERF